jgi:Mrp family chromosome partitioning ATPase
MRQRSDMRTTLGARHPALVEINAQVSTLRQLIQEELGRISESVRNDYERARANEESLERGLDGLKRHAVNTNEALVPLRELERELQTSRAVYESFLVRARETGEQGQLDTKNIRIISRADAPMRRSWPPRNLVLMFGAMMFGAAVGTGLAVLRQAKSDAKQLPAPVKSSPHFPLLAALPRLAASCDLEVITRPRSQFSAQIQGIEEAVQQRRSKKGHHSVLIISAKDDGDAALVALNLAAQSSLHQRVLVIDADSRRTTISSLLPSAPGAALLDAVKDSRPLIELVNLDERTNINIIALGSTKLADWREFRPDEIRDAFGKTRSFDLVIVTAPIRKGDGNARLFSSLVDEIVLVIDAAGTREQDLANVFASVDGNESKMLGVVVANVDAASRATDGFGGAAGLKRRA